MIGFIPNDVPFAHDSDKPSGDDELDFVKVREEFLRLESVERRDAFEDYNRLHRGRKAF